MYKYGLELKTDLSLGDMLRLVRLSSFAEQVHKEYSKEDPGLVRRVFLYLSTLNKLLWVKREMVKILTCARFPMLATHKLTRIFNELGLNKQPQKGSQNPEAALTNISNHLSVHLGQTPLDVLGGTTIQQAEQIYFGLELAKLERQIEASLSHHATPKDYINSLQKDIRRLEADKKKAQGKRVIPDDKKVIDMQEAREFKEENTNEYKMRNMFKY